MTKLLHIKIFILVILITLAKVDLYAQTVLSPTEDVCAGELKQYKVEGSAGSTIYWSVQGGDIYNAGSLVIDQDLATPGFQYSELIVSGESVIGILWNVTAGNYLVRAYEETASLCVSANMDLTVTVSNLPDQSLTLSNPSVCPGGTATITLTNSESGVNYQLRLNSDDSNVGVAVAGSGGNITFDVNTAVTTVYNVYAENLVSTCGVELDNKSTITVEDLIDPVAVCQDITIQLDGSGNASITASQIDNGSTDNCTAVASLEFSLDKTNFTCADLGANTVVLTVTDESSNVGTCNATVTVEDTTKPVADLASLPNVTAECEVTSLTAPTATDNCSTVTVTNDAVLPINTQGTTVVTWTYKDVVGNASTQTQNIVIDDITNPVAPILADVTGECSATAVAPTTTDACAGTITGATTDPLVYTTQGEYTITWTFDDGEGDGSLSKPFKSLGAARSVTASGRYYFDLGNGAFQADVDNGEGGGWVLILQYYHSGGTNPATSVVGVGSDLPLDSSSSLGTDLSGTSSWGHAGNAALSDMTGAEELRWYAKTSGHSRIIHFKSAVGLAYAQSGSGSFNGIEVGYTLLTGHTANLPAAARNEFSNRGNEALTNFPMWLSGTYHWGIRGLGNRWEVDDYAGGGANSTIHKMWVRGSLISVGNVVTATQKVIVEDVTAPVADLASLPNVTAECEVTSLTAPSATDNCSAVTVTNDASLPINTQGTTVVTWTYKDVVGNTSTQTQNVVITDATAPVADLASLPNVTAECEVTSLTAPSATDNCSAVTVTNDASLPINTQGTTVVTWTYKDVVGNTSTQTQNVVITDATAPVADLASLPNVVGQCEVTSLTAPTATDNCSVVTVTNDASLPINAQGTTVVTWTYKDVVGNTSTQTQNVIITDNTAPVADLASLPNVVGQCEVTSLTAPTATDNCSVVTVTNDASLPINAQGTTLVTWTYKDVVGNTSTQTQNVIITDNTAPVADLASLPNVVGQCEVTSLTAPTATDNCSVVTVTNDASLPINAQGTTLVTWTYKDVVGNTSTQTQNVIITDNTAPVADLASLPNVVGQCEVTSLTAPTATDNCSVVTVTNDASLPINAQGTTVVTWTYKDVVGNTSTQTQNVIITDNTAPVADLASLPNVVGQCEVTSLTAPTATDNCSVVTVTNDASLPINAQGTTVVTWTYKDVVGNTSTQTQNVIITDNTAPVADLASLPNVVGQCEVTSLTAPTATDNCSVVTVTNDASLPINAQGTTVVTWTYKDVVGNTSTQTQNVIITDNTAPVADLASLPNVVGQCEVTSLTAPTATDNCSVVTVTNDASLPINAQGTTVVTWTYKDVVGNTSTQTQNVIITDNTAPVADLASLPNVVGQCEVTSLTAPTATDNCSVVTVTNDASLPINTQGTTVVTWTYKDVVGNTSTQTQNVVITDATAPVADLASLPNVTAECEVTSLTAPSATDNCSAVTVTNDASLPINTQGTTVVTWTYKDVVGNTSTQTQNVVITDATAPVADLASLPNVTAECEVTSLTAPSATDNCSAVTVTNDASLPINTQGTTVVTWTYKDVVGNTSTQTQNVVITDATAPVADLASLPNVTAECEVTSLTAPSATDNCSAVTVTNDASLPINTQGTTVVTWTYKDVVGNTSTQTQNVVITDATDPVVPTLADVTGECSATATIPTTTDNCTGVLIGTTSDALTYTTQGTHVIAWLFDDGNGNSIVVNQNVIISDVTSPVLADLSDLAIVDCAEDESVIPQVKAFTGLDIQAARYSDNCSATFVVQYRIQLPDSSFANTYGTVAVGASSISDPSGYNFPEGVSTIHFRVLDASGNISNVKTYTVTVNHKPIPSGIIY